MDRINIEEGKEGLVVSEIRWLIKSHILDIDYNTYSALVQLTGMIALQTVKEELRDEG